MRGNNVLGIIFSNIHEERLREITDKRTMGSVPFGSRYRLIDFPLSNMVNSGINKVGVVTKQNYQSLMDHLGSGKAWDLSRKRDGLFILPPFGNSRLEFNNRIETLSAISGFLVNSKEEYVLLSDCDVICNINYQNVIDKHVKNNADITIIYKYGKVPENYQEVCVLSMNNGGRVKELYLDPKIEGKCNFGINMVLIKRELLVKLIDQCISKNKTNFKRDLLQKSVAEYRVFGYEFRGYSWVISSMNSYFESNMDLTKTSVRSELFNDDKPIYTKVRDDMPGKYGLMANVKNSVVANGCIIDGDVKNCVIFRGVKIEKGVNLENCIVMQDTVISEGCDLKYVICDKDVKIKSGRILMGFKSYPIYISKASVV